MEKNTAIRAVGELIKSLRDVDHSLRVVDGDLWSFWHEGAGGISLTRQQRRKYGGVLAELTREYSPRDEMSRTAINRLLETALLHALDPENHRSNETFDARLNAAIANLKAGLAKDQMRYEICVPVSGLALKGLPFKFGRVRFVKFSEHRIRKLNAELKHWSVSDEQLQLRKQENAKLRDTDTWGAPCAVVDVFAKDHDAAHDLAKREIRRTMDTINYFTDLVPYNHGELYFPGERARAGVASVIVAEDHSLYWLDQLQGPIGDFSLKALKTEESLRPLATKLKKMLSSQNQCKLDQLILNTVQLAGRATVEQRRDLQFLLFAIAHESIALPTSQTAELGYRLRIRTAHLLGKTMEQRDRIVKEVRHLYSIRSKIVHDAYSEVTYEDVMRMTFLVKRLILAVILNRGVAKLNTPEEFETWWERKILQ